MVGYVTDCLAFNGGSVIIGCGMDVGEEVSGEREGLLERPSLLPEPRFGLEGRDCD